MFNVGSLKRLAHTKAVVAGVLVLVIPVGLWVGGAQPGAAGLIPTPWDKFAHAGVFMVLAWATARTLQPWVPRAAFWGFVLALLVGLLDEWHQLGLVGRSADLQDLLADTVGAAMGARLWWLRRHVTLTSTQTGHAP